MIMLYWLIFWLYWCWNNYSQSQIW